MLGALTPSAGTCFEKARFVKSTSILHLSVKRPTREGASAHTRSQYKTPPSAITRDQRRSVDLSHDCPITRLSRAASTTALLTSRSAVVVIVILRDPKGVDGNLIQSQLSARAENYLLAPTAGQTPVAD